MGQPLKNLPETKEKIKYLYHLHSLTFNLTTVDLSVHVQNESAEDLANFQLRFPLVSVKSKNSYYNVIFEAINFVSSNRSSTPLLVLKAATQVSQCQHSRIECY